MRLNNVTNSLFFHNFHFFYKIKPVNNVLSLIKLDPDSRLEDAEYQSS